MLLHPTPILSSPPGPGARGLYGSRSNQLTSVQQVDFLRRIQTVNVFHSVGNSFQKADFVDLLDYNNYDWTQKYAYLKVAESAEKNETRSSV